MSLLRRRSKGRSCTLHGDNGCEVRGEAGPRTRASEKRSWTVEARSDDEARTLVYVPSMGRFVSRSQLEYWKDEGDLPPSDIEACP